MSFGYWTPPDISGPELEFEPVRFQLLKNKIVKCKVKISICTVNQFPMEKGENGAALTGETPPSLAIQN